MPGFTPFNYEDTIPGFWDWDLENRSVFSDPILKKSLGYEADEFPDKWIYWKNLVHKTDWVTLKQSFRKYLHSEVDMPYVQEIRFFHKKGHTVYILLLGRIIQRGSGGLPRKMIGSHVDITSQKLAKRELLLVKNLLAKTSKAVNAGGWELDLSTNEILYTETTKVILGVPDNFVPVRGYFSSLIKDPEIKRKFARAQELAIHTGETFDLELNLINAQGKDIWVRCNGQPELQEGKAIRLFGVIQDITMAKTTRDKLRIKEQQLVTFIKFSPVAIAMMDKEMNYIAASDVWKSFFSLEQADLNGRNYYEIFPHTTETWKEYHRRGLAGETLKMDEDSFVLPDDSVEWLQWEIRPWYEAHGEVGGIIVYTAVVSEKHAVKETLIKAKDRAEQSLLIKTRFLSVMSHEMRTPLNAVIGFINILLQDPRPDQLEHMNVLKFSAENLLVLINDILDFSKVEASKVELEQNVFNFNHLLHNITAALRHAADSKRLDLTLKIDPLIPQYLVGDAGRVGQIITNLVTNAIKFTPSGSVSIACLLGEQDSDTVTVHTEISDTGIGIAFDKQEVIFEMFSQAELGTSRIYGGTGLGLAISKRLLEIMGSRIHLSSELNQGSTFSFDIVFTKSSKTPVKNSQTDLAIDPILSGAKILIVDDLPVNILLVKRFLDQWSCDCSIAANGKIALDLVMNNDFDLVLMDLEMPVMNGYEATKEIRKLSEKKFRELPIIAFSASPMAEVSEMISGVGINDYIGKPFSPRTLHDKVTSYLKNNITL
jgi:PAS domain S-box-containing protein